MPTTNFDKQTIKKINEVLRFVSDNPRSDFYIKRFGTEIIQIQSLEDFQKLPLLSKDDFLPVKIQDRIFFPSEEITNYSFSSGTTKSDTITIIPQVNAKKIPSESVSALEYGEEVLKSRGVKKIMLLWPITSSAYSRHMSSNYENRIVIPADVKNIAFSAVAAKKIKIDGLITTSTILEHFLDELEKINFDLSSIKWISLGGEFCTAQKFTYFKNKFSSAFISFRFGSSELRGRGYRCKYLKDENPSVFHPNPLALIEIVDENGKPSSEGEIIHTTLYPRPFPMLRYHTGDHATLKRKICRCGAEYLLTIGGKIGTDILKLSGVTLHAQAIENSLDSVREYIKPFFQIHVFEKTVNSKFKPQLEIHLALKKEFENKKDDSFFMEILLKKISSCLYLTANSTLSQLVEKNIFLPPTIIISPKLTENNTKSKHIISHLQ